MLQSNDGHELGSSQATNPVAGIELPKVYDNGGKRLLDLTLILLALPFLIPVMIVVALAVMLDGGSPFYTQKRLGRGWQSFRLYKFRTMKPQADLLLEAHLAANPAARAEWDADQKLRNDPRVTLGHMSLVGPRPMMPEQRVLYPGVYYAAHRPGLTGLWQVSVRNGSTFATRAVFDERYSREISLALDVSTIARTFQVVARCTGC